MQDSLFINIGSLLLSQKAHNLLLTSSLYPSILECIVIQA
nr:MAG TPA_asm: hypothetical protein [Caudoviricetes sp.]